MRPPPTDYAEMLRRATWRTRLAYALLSLGLPELAFLIVAPADRAEMGYRYFWGCWR